MKKLLALITAIIVVTSCTKKSSPVPQQASSAMSGKWFIKTDTLKQYFSGTLKYTVPIAKIPGAYYQFNADGTGSLNNDDTGQGAIEHFNYTYLATTRALHIDFPVQLIDGGNLPELVEDGSVVSLTSTNMTILLDNSQVNINGHEEDNETIVLYK